MTIISNISSTGLFMNKRKQQKQYLQNNNNNIQLQQRYNNIANITSDKNTAENDDLCTKGVQ